MIFVVLAIASSCSVFFPVSTRPLPASIRMNASAPVCGALCAAAQALGRAFARIQPLSLWLCALGALGLLLTAAFFGMDVLLCASPLLLLPEGILLVWSFVKR